MKTICVLLAMLFCLQGMSQSVVGKWKRVSNMVEADGQKMDMQVALLKARPCMANTVYEYLPNGGFVLHLTGCDATYAATQQKLFGKTKWKLEGDKLSTPVTNFALSNVYTVSFAGNKMTWKDASGTAVYEKL